MTMLMHHMLRAAAGYAASPPSNDPQFSNVSMLLNDTGTNGQQNNTFLDSSVNNFTVTRNGTPTQGSVTPYWSLGLGVPYSAVTYGGSGYFSGTSQYLSMGGQTAFAYGTGAFTIEMWVYPTAIKLQRIYDGRPSGNGAYPTIGMNASGKFDYTASSAIRITGTTTAVVNTWYHIVICRSGTSTKLFVNGVQEGVTYSDSLNYLIVAGRPFIGADSFSAGSNAWSGYISNTRIVKGTAVYTANFTPPTAPVTAITNTSLLLNYTNAGIYDAAVRNDLVTVGDAKVSTAQAKFGSSSMAFDGTGDWLTFADNSSMQMGSGDFTIEGWVYLSALGSARGFFSKGTSTTGISFGVNSSNQLVFNYTVSTLTASTALSSGQWYYVAVVRSGSASGNVKIYLNGSVDATSGGAITDNFNQTNAGYVGADRVGTSPMNGYIDDLRITKGYARTITTPTSPFPTR
jgi:hypothetical protein